MQYMLVRCYELCIALRFLTMFCFSCKAGLVGSDTGSQLPGIYFQPRKRRKALLRRCVADTGRKIAKKWKRYMSTRDDANPLRPSWKSYGERWKLKVNPRWCPEMSPWPEPKDLPGEKNVHGQTLTEFQNFLVDPHPAQSCGDMFNWNQVVMSMLQASARSALISILHKLPGNVVKGGGMCMG